MYNSFEKVRYSVMQNLTRNLPEVYPVMKKWRKVLDEYAGKGKEKWVHIFQNAFDLWYCISRLQLKSVFHLIFRILIAESYGITNEMRDSYYEVDSMPFNFAFVQKLNRSCKAFCIQNIINSSLDGLKEEWWPNFVVFWKNYNIL